MLWQQPACGRWRYVLCLWDPAYWYGNHNPMQQHKVTLEINELLIGNHDGPIPEALHSLPLEPSGFFNPSAKLNLGCTVVPLLISLWSEPCEECVTQTFAHFTLVWDSLQISSSQNLQQRVYHLFTFPATTDSHSNSTTRRTQEQLLSEFYQYLHTKDPRPNSLQITGRKLLPRIRSKFCFRINLTHRTSIQTEKKKFCSLQTPELQRNEMIISCARARKQTNNNNNNQHPTHSSCERKN